MNESQRIKKIKSKNSMNPSNNKKITVEIKLENRFEIKFSKPSE